MSVSQSYPSGDVEPRSSTLPPIKPTRAYWFWIGRDRSYRTMRQIASDVAEGYGLTPTELMSRTRAFRIAHPRQEAMWLMAETGRYSLPQIGRFFGRDHTTVLHGVRAHAKRRAEGTAAQ